MLVFAELDDKTFQTRSLMEPNDQESCASSQTSNVCVWVGMIPTSYGEFDVKGLKGRKGAPKKGSSIKMGQNSLIAQHDEKALRVVVVLAHVQTSTMYLYRRKTVSMKQGE